jgi:hypothetical protein
MNKRLIAFLSVLSLFLSSPISPANAAAKAGAKCTKSGNIEVVKGKTFTCIKSGKKLVWNKGTASKGSDSNTDIFSLSLLNMKKSMIPQPIKQPFKYHYSPNAIESYKTIVEKELELSMSYFASVYKETKQFNVFYGTEKDLDWIIEAWKVYDLDKNGYTANDYRGRIERSKKGSSDPNNSLVIGSVPSQDGQSHFSILRHSLRPNNTPAFIAHESIHIVQQSLTQSKTDRMPCWLREGSAELFSLFIMSEQYGADRARKTKEQSVMNGYQFATYEVEIRKFNKTEWFDHIKGLEGNFRDGCDFTKFLAYGTGLLLSEALIAESGFAKMMDFWRAFSLDKDWRDSFKAIYGVEIDVWYKAKGIPYVMSEYARVPGYK